MAQQSDEYIRKAVRLMNEGEGKLEDRQKQLDNVFKEATDSLVKDKISQESFRTFNEAYKTTREAIERERQIEQQKTEQEQKELSARHVNAVVELLQTQDKSKDLLQKELNTVLQQVADDLIAKKISQASFRTFIETYKTTRDAIVSQ